MGFTNFEITYNMGRMFTRAGLFLKSVLTCRVYNQVDFLEMYKVFELGFNIEKLKFCCFFNTF